MSRGASRECRRIAVEKLDQVANESAEGAIELYGENNQLRVGVLEWICGGGMSAVPINSVSRSLLREGWLMLSHLAADLLAANQTTVVTVDPCCLPPDAIGDSLATEVVKVSPRNLDEQFDCWSRAFNEVDALIVIAPECERVLEDLLAMLRARGIYCANCRGDFLRNSADKLLTAQMLQQFGLNHPETALANSIDANWIRTRPSPSEYWALKPRDGAGCEELRRVHTLGLKEYLSGAELVDSRAIVQPWLDGHPCSRSAIVDAAGRCHWLPLVTQKLSLGDRPKYNGGYVASGIENLRTNPVLDEATRQISSVSRSEIAQLDAMLDSAVVALGTGALAWIGVDLLYNRESAENPFTIIEINPRLTTSFIGLRQACDESLARQMLNAAFGRSVVLPSFVRSVEFTASVTGQGE